MNGPGSDEAGAAAWGHSGAPQLPGRWVRRRAALVAAVLTLLFAGLAYRAYQIQIADGARYRRRAEEQQLQLLQLPAPRGVVYDRRGRELAITASVESVYGRPRDVVDVARTATALAAVVGGDVRALKERLGGDRPFVWVARQIDDRRAGAVRALGLAGVGLVPEARRFYPSRTTAGPVLGFVNIDGKGMEGIELALDALLTGHKTTANALRDATGRVMMADKALAPEAGASAVLTLDRTVQLIAENALAAAVTQHGAKAGSIVVLEVATGGVLAMANWPTFDPNRPAQAAALGARNRAVTDTYEIGSAMKIFTIAAALEAGLVTAGTVIDVEGGRYRVGRKLVRDTFRDHRLTVADILKRSSNVGVVKLAERLGAEALHAALRRYRFGSETGIELPGEQPGRIREPRRWGPVGLATISFGYGMSTTALQLAAAYAAVGAGGIYRPPRIIQRVVSASGVDVELHNPRPERIMSAATAEQLRQMLAGVLEAGPRGGTAGSLRVPGYRAGGKTATAHKVDPETKTYSDELYLSSFAGIVPIDDPILAIVVVVDEPGGDAHYGAEVAGPAFARVASQSLRYLGAPPETSVSP